MSKHSIIFFGMALSIGLVSCGSDSNNESSTSGSPNSTMMDSANNMNGAPAQGMGDSTLFQDSGRARGTGTANDGIIRNGGGSTSTGDSVRGSGGDQ